MAAVTAVRAATDASKPGGTAGEGLRQRIGGSTICCLCVSASSIDALSQRLGCEVMRLRSV